MLLQDEYQMFSDEYIPVEETLAVLLRMFAAQSHGSSQETPSSSTRPDLLEVDDADSGHLDSNHSSDVIELDTASPPPPEVIELRDASRGVITLDNSSDEEIVCLD